MSAAGADKGTWVIEMMSRTLVHSRHLRRQALHRCISAGIVIQTRTMGFLTVDCAPDSLGFFTAHDQTGQAYEVPLSDVTFPAF